MGGTEITSEIIVKPHRSKSEFYSEVLCLRFEFEMLVLLMDRLIQSNTSLRAIVQAHHLLAACNITSEDVSHYL